MKSFLIGFIKLAIASGLIGYLVYNGSLDFKQLSILISDPVVGLAAIGHWLIGPAILGALRWRLILQASGFQISAKRAISLQLMGFFFNTAMPGAVGGDLVKVLYVIKENDGNGKTQAMMSVMLDRILGMVSIFVIGLVCLLSNSHLRTNNAVTYQSFVTIIASVCICAALFFIAALVEYKKEDPFEMLLSKNIIGFRVLLKIYRGIRQFRKNKATLLGCFFLSICLQLMAIGYFYVISYKLVPQDNPSYWSIASVFPLGILTIALPISPGGLGVGHVAFEKLLTFVGISNGAGIFNIYLLSQIALNLIGAIPYVRSKGRKSVRPTSHAFKHS